MRRLAGLLLQNGNKHAVEKFSGELERPISESTVCGFKKAYYTELKKVKVLIRYYNFSMACTVSQKSSVIWIRTCRSIFAIFVLLGFQLTVPLSLQLLGVLFNIVVRPYCLNTVETLN